MRHAFRRRQPSFRLLLFGMALALVPAATAWASKLILKDGRILEGRLVRLSSLAEMPKAVPADGAPPGRMIVMCDDNLRRYFVSTRQVQEANEAGGAENTERFNVWQPLARNGNRIGRMGQLLRVTAFDDHGRRTLEMSSERGPVSLVQGITLITPTWTKVEGLDLNGGTNLLLDMRIATNSIPRETLGKILASQTDAKNVEHRLKIARLYLQSERYKDAEEELAAIVADFPEREKQFASTQRDLKQAYARRALAEIEVRRDAGQHKLVLQLLQSFPAEGVAGETLRSVRQMQEEYQKDYDAYTGILKQFDEHLSQIGDATLRERIKPIRDEIAAELSIHTLGRMATYQQLWGDDSLSVEDKLALAISGWLVGSDDAIRRLPVALSLFAVRDLVRKYLAEPIKIKRNQALAGFASQEGATPELVAKLLWHMRPPIELPPPNPTAPDAYELSVDTLPGEPAVTYHVQLPPQYDPYRLYPTILTLHGSATTPAQQIDWWAGEVAKNGMRLGHATRNGYIVIAPAWGKEHQTSYQYSAAEHAAVLNTLRDACRRFAIDTDRVYLSGHSMGGDAAWDIGLAHPDIWAAVLPIVARSDKYIRHYWENGKLLPMYLVGGELDGDKSVNNAADLDRYMDHGYNATVVEFQGRGHEHFSDEILRLFEFMRLHERNFFPMEFSCRTMRTWDNYFWWVELAELPEKSIVDPESWPPGRGVRALSTRAKVTTNNGMNVRTGAAQVTLWLSPEIIDFKQKVSITVNGDRLKLPGSFIEPDLGVLLEDARARGDRQHPFWAKVEMPAGRVNVAGL